MSLNIISSCTTVSNSILFHINVPHKAHYHSTLDKAAYLRKYAIKIMKKAIKIKCVRTEKQF